MASARVPLALSIILGVYLALYAQTRRFGFVWVDEGAIRDSAVYDLPLGRQLRTTEHARMNPQLMELHGIVLTHESWRPLLILSHGLDHALFGRAPAPMHLVNVLLGALAILTAFWLAARLFGAVAPALMVTAIFAWHPLHVEPIAFLSARGDPLAGALALAAAALVVETAPVGGAPRSRRAVLALAVAAGACMLLSLSAKEASVGLPLALAGFALATGRLRAWAAGLAALVAGIPLYAGLRAILVAGAPAATHGSRITHALAALPAIAFEYARSFLLPFDLSISRPVYLSAAAGWLLLALVAVALALALRRAASGWRPTVAMVAASLVFVGALLAPSAVAVFSEAAVADRYAYLPLLGFAIALVALGARLPRRAAVGSGALFLGLCLFVTARELPVWASNATLYAHAVEVEPGSAGAHNRLGRWLGERGAWPAAVVELERAAALPDAGDRVLNNLGVAYLNVGRAADAETTLRLAVDRSHETSFHAWYNLGTAQRLRGDGAAACASFRRALVLSPQYEHARADLLRYCPTLR